MPAAAQLVPAHFELLSRSEPLGFLLRGRAGGTGTGTGLPARRQSARVHTVGAAFQQQLQTCVGEPLHAHPRLPLPPRVRLAAPGRLRWATVWACGRLFHVLHASDMQYVRCLKPNMQQARPEASASLPLAASV